MYRKRMSKRVRNLPPKIGSNMKRLKSKEIKEFGNIDEEIITPGESLNDNQKQFCVNYLSTMNATESYIEAYGDMKRGAASASSSRLLKREDIKDYISYLIDEYSNNIDVEMGEIMSEMKRLAMYKDAEAFPGTKLNALKLLGQSMGMFEEKLEITNRDIVVGLVDDDGEVID